MVQGTVAQDVSSKVTVVRILTGPQSSAIESLDHRAAMLRDEGFENFSGLINELIQWQIHGLIYLGKGILLKKHKFLFSFPYIMR